MLLVRRVVAVVVAVALLWSFVPQSWSVASPVGVPVEVPGEGGGGVVRPDWVSASVTARALGRRVEVLSERTEFGRSWVRPDGVVDEEVSAGPVRFADALAPGGWRDVDTRLVADGHRGWRAAAVKVPVVVDPAGGGAGGVVGVAGVLSVALDGVRLPDPVVEGSSARFVDVVPGVDVSVEVLPAGFELLWVVKSKSGVAELVKRWGRSGQVVLPTTISVDGEVTASAGGLVVSDAKGRRVGAFGAPVMWEAASSPVEERGESTAVVFRVDPKKGRGKGAQSTRRVDVVASVAWLNQPSRRFPVTIDPTYASDFRAPVFDTFVQQGFTTDQSAGGELKVGNNGAGQVARTYMNFDASLFRGRTIVAASLSLFAKYSWSCTAKSWSAYDAGLASAASRWTSQPVVGAKVGSSTATRGYSSSCPAGRVSMSNLTGVAQSWSGATSAQVGLMLRADDEADPWGWKRFYSANSNYQPLLSVSYNRVMAAPGVPGVSGPLYRGVVWTTRTPTLTAVVPHDPDGDTVRADFGVFTSSTAGTGAVGSCRTGMVAGGSSVSCVTSALPDNRTLWARYRVWDGRNYSAWSPARQFTVADSVPDTPTIACVAPFSNGSWVDAAPAADVACTVRFTGSNTSAPLWATYTVDGTTYNLSPTGTSQERRTCQFPGSQYAERGSKRQSSKRGNSSRSGEEVDTYGAPARSFQERCSS